MNRQEFDKGIEDGLPIAYICSKYINSLEQRNAELEQRVKELEKPKTCDGCVWYDELHPSCCDCLEQCVRFKHGWDKDRYEQKDSE